MCQFLCVCIDPCLNYRAKNYGVTTTSSHCDEDRQAGVVTLLHNIIIAGDEHARAWFAQYLKCMQQKVRKLADRTVTDMIMNCLFERYLQSLL